MLGAATSGLPTALIGTANSLHISPIPHLHVLHMITLSRGRSNLTADQHQQHSESNISPGGTRHRKRATVETISSVTDMDLYRRVSAQDGCTPAVVGLMKMVS